MKLIYFMRILICIQSVMSNNFTDETKFTCSNAQSLITSFESFLCFVLNYILFQLQPSTIFLSLVQTHLFRIHAF